MARYAWVITQDLSNPFGEFDVMGDRPTDPEKLFPERVGVSGPSTATDEEILRALTEGDFFRILDDDGHPYYIGRCWCEDGTDSEDGFGPLDDWGRADVGATDIQYRKDGKWETL